MQAEQTKKSTAPTKEKKEKKVKTSKETSEEVVSTAPVAPVSVPVSAPEPVPTPPVSAPEPVPTPAPEPVQSEPVVQVATEEPKSEVVVLDVDFENVLDFLNSSSDRFTELSRYFKENTLSKDERGKVDTSLKKLTKASNLFSVAYSDYLARQLTSFEKYSNGKHSSKSSVKKTQDKEKSAIHKKLNVYPFLLEFMKLPPSTVVSRSDALTAITGYVKTEKVGNPSIIVEDDKRSFKLVGELKTLFTGIEKIMSSKNLLVDKQMPTQIKYTQIMQYMTHCFIKQEEATAVSVV